MDNEKVGKFIKELRKSKNWSQEELASKIYCERTKINKIENGKRSIKIDEAIILSELFGISIEELIAGERKTSKNTNIIQSAFKEYLKQQNTKIKKFRLLITILIFIFIICFLVVSSLYFFQNYKSIRIYRFSGSSNNYEINDGLLIISKEKMYFKIDQINSNVNNIEIYSEINNSKELIYSGDANVTLSDNYGYESFISYDDFIKEKQNIYIIINDEEIKLNFNEDFINNKLFYIKKKKIKEKENNKEKLSIPNKIKQEFTCNGKVCHLDLENESLTYNNGIFTIASIDYYLNYDIENSLIDYQNENNSKLNVTISLKDNNIICITGNCNNMEKIYKEVYNNYILKYIK